MMSGQLNPVASVVFGVALISACGVENDRPLAAAQSSNSIVEPAVSPGETAAEILAVMVKAYANCSSYRDTGTVTTTFTRGGGDGEQLAFKTAFIRGSGFRFEYAALDGVEEGHSYIVWADAQSARTWWWLRPGLNEAPSLNIAISGATGVSSGSAHTVPRLLLPQEIGGWATDQVVDPRCEASEMVNGRLCTKIVAKHPRGSPRAIWIDQETHLIRRLFKSYESDDKSLAWETTTTYTPELDVAIDPDELAFNPPESP